jgi:hypothetical protein
MTDTSWADEVVPAPGGATTWADPVEGAPAPQPGYAEDIVKGAAGGLGRGTAGLIGAGGTIGGLIHAGLGKLGVPEEYLQRGAQAARTLGPAIPALGLLAGPDAADVQKSMESVTGEFYQPKTVPGQYASTIGEFAPAALMPGGGGLAARALNTVAPAVASETAGQLTKGSVAEPYARFVTGLAAGPAAARLVTPAGAATPAWTRMTQTLENEGIPLMAGQRTGSAPIRYLESNAADMPLSARRVAELRLAQTDAFDRAITHRMFDRNELTARGVPEDVNLPDPRVVNAGRQSLQDEYTRLTSQNDLISDPRLHHDLMAARLRYEANTLPSQRAGGARDLEALHNEIIDRLVAGQGAMPGGQYQAMRSRFGTTARAVAGSDPYLHNALRDYRNALDQAMHRSLPPEEAAAWALNNQRYANMKQLAGAVARAGENLSPQAVAQTARVGRAEQFAGQRGNLDALAKAAAVVLRQPPNSGTAQRLGWQQLFGLPGMLSGGGGIAGSAFGPVGAVVGAAAPHLFSRAMVSNLGQRYLANQALPQNTRDVIAQALLQQTIQQRPERLRVTPLPSEEQP